MKHKIHGSVIFLLVALASVYAMNQADVTNSYGRESKKVKPIKVYKYNKLRDISADGQDILFYQTKVPVRLYTLNSDGTGKAHQPDDVGDVLRVVSFNTGQEISRQKVIDLSADEQFIPNSKKIYFGDREERSYKIWSYELGKFRSCRKKDGLDFQSVVFLDGEQAFGVVRKEKSKEGHLFATFELPSCEVKLIDELYPNSRGDVSIREFIHGGISISADSKRLAYSVSQERMVIRDTKTLKIVNEFFPNQLSFSFYRKHQFTLDGKYFITNATNYANPDRGEIRKYYILIYDAQTFKLVRRLEVPGDLNLAVSPDSQFAAVAYKTTEKEIFTKTEQAHIVLINLETGVEVAKISHPKLKEKRNDPWQSIVNKIMFTPDGKYILTSTNDTFVWDISLLTNERG